MNPPNPTPPPMPNCNDFGPPDWFSDFFAFRTMLTPILVRILFVIGLPIIVIAAFCWCFEGYNPNSSGASAYGRFIGALLLSAVGFPMLRVACETAIVLFSIHEEIRKK